MLFSTIFFWRLIDGHSENGPIQVTRYDTSHVCKAVKSVMLRPESNNFVPAVQLLSKFTSGKKIRVVYHSVIGHHLETTKYEGRNKMTKAE